MENNMVSPQRRRELDEKIARYMKRKYPDKSFELTEDNEPVIELTMEESQQIIDGLKEMTQMLRDMKHERRN